MKRGLGEYGVWGLEFRVWDLGLRFFSVLGLKIRASRFRV